MMSGACQATADTSAIASAHDGIFLVVEGKDCHRLIGREREMLIDLLDVMLIKSNRGALLCGCAQLFGRCCTLQLP